MGLLDRIIKAKPVERALQGYMQDTVGKAVENSLATNKATGAAATPLANGRPAARMTRRYEVDFQQQEGSVFSKLKPGSSVPFDVLRRFSVVHEVSRAAINYRKRQIGGLPWDIVAEDEEDTGKHEAAIKEVQAFFKMPAPRTRYRNFTYKVIEDLLTLDAVALEKKRTLGGGLLGLIPVDAATIRLRVDESGATPEPPEIAYKQVIRGTVVAELTADEMIYDMLNPRSNSPYGLAPLESLILIVTSALRAETYNLAYLTDGNIPEGFVSVPDDWSPEMIKTFQENWDAAMAGDAAASRRLKFIPPGQYTPTKKPEDMAFDKFNQWLMLVACAVFEVPPTEIGFQPAQQGLGGKGVNEAQAESGEKKGQWPLIQFLSDIWTEVIHNDLGHPELRFKFRGFDEEYELNQAELNKALIHSGQRTTNEQRTEDGLDPYDPKKYPLADTPFVMAGNTLVTLDDEPEEAPDENEGSGSSAVLLDANGKPIKADDMNHPKPDDKHEPVEQHPKQDQQSEKAFITLVTELRKFRKMATNRIKAGKAHRDFESEVLPQSVVDELNKKMREAETVEDAREVLKGYMEDYQVRFLADAYELKQATRDVLEAPTP